MQIDKDTGMISPDYRPARLPRWYEGASVGGIQVGRGNHDGVGNPSQILRFRTNSFWSANYNDGSFETVSDGTDPGDSGGPIFTSDPGGWLVVHGGLWGYLLDWFAFRNRYTSTAYHLSSILTAMGNVNVYNWNYYGNDIGMFSGVDTLACATACTQNASCKAWTLDPQPAGSTVGNCWLKSGTGTGGFAQYGLTSGYKTQNMITRTGWDYPGNDLGPSYSGYSEFACQNLCWNRSDCQAYTYTPVAPGAGWGSCWLKSSVGAGGNPLSGFNSGHKTSTLPCSPSGGVCAI